MVFRDRAVGLNTHRSELTGAAAANAPTAADDTDPETKGAAPA